MMVKEQKSKRLESLEPYRELAEKLDTADELACFRNEFVIDDPSLIYMDGNSLGRLPKRSVERAASVVNEEWGKLLIRSWGINWYAAPRKIGAKIARLIGAAGSEVIMSDSTTNNLFKVVMAALMMQPGRKTIVSDEFNFPSDLYVLQGCSNIFGGRVQHRSDPFQRMELRSDERIEIALIDSDTAVVVLSHVVFKSGFLYDAARITDMAHKKGALVVWDLSHSVGSVPVDLDGWNADFAIGCTYKYLNGGPGAPAFLYVNQKYPGEGGISHLGLVWRRQSIQF